ncbi:hypothetical protein GGR34_000753 [Microvirga flocculans]|uniref:Uncharacterized protein n=1 Tax=Microvirga flocculans TaxID=217168 RepID=A0A7W6N6L6_9HYPH|nr:hypothetical protein [Microvirga flocculans]MBB4039118.1 hypothetical protein [Microvirga flocculans]
MLTFILGASLTLNLGLLYFAWEQDKAIEAAQEVIVTLMGSDDTQEDSSNND